MKEPWFENDFIALCGGQEKIAEKLRRK